MSNNKAKCFPQINPECLFLASGIGPMPFFVCYTVGYYKKCSHKVTFIYSVRIVVCRCLQGGGGDDRQMRGSTTFISQKDCSKS